MTGRWGWAATATTAATAGRPRGGCAARPHSDRRRERWKAQRRRREGAGIPGGVGVGEEGDVEETTAARPAAGAAEKMRSVTSLMLRLQKNGSCHHEHCKA